MRALHVAALGLSLVGCGAGASSAPPSTPAEPPAAQAEAPPGKVDGAQAHALVRGGAKLVDVRTPAEYAAGHVEGAMNVPVDTVAEHDFGAKDAPLVVYCGSGKRAARAAEALRAAGHTRVYDLGAMSSWDE